MSEFVAAFAAFQEAHAVYMSYLSDESSILRCRESFERESPRKDDFIHEVQGWIKRNEEVTRLDSQLRRRRIFLIVRIHKLLLVHTCLLHLFRAEAIYLMYT